MFILVWLFLSTVFSTQLSLDVFVTPFSQTISQDVAGNMSLVLSGKKTRSSGIKARYISKIHEKFTSKVSPILVSHLKSFIVILII